VDYTIGAEYYRQQSYVKEGNVFSLYFSAPLLVFNRNQGEIARAQQEQEQIAVRLRALEADIRNEVQTIYQRYAISQEVMQRMETQMLARAQSVRNTMEYSYKRGQATFIEFLDAQRTFNDTRQSYHQARADYAKSLYQLDAVSGASVTAATGETP